MTFKLWLKLCFCKSN